MTRTHTLLAGVGSLLAGGLLAGGCAGSADPDAAAPSTVVRSAQASAAATIGPLRSFQKQGTGAPSVATRGAAPDPGSPPRITLRRTGGLAGVFQTLVVRPDGVWAWTDGRGGSGATPQPAGQQGRLNAAQRAELARLAARPELAAEARLKPGPAKCADGFDYLLAVGRLTVVWGECGSASPPTAVAMTELLASATPY